MPDTKETQIEEKHAESLDNQRDIANRISELLDGEDLFDSMGALESVIVNIVYRVSGYKREIALLGIESVANDMKCSIPYDPGSSRLH